MKKLLKLTSLLLLSLTISGCDWFETDDDEVEASTGSGTVTPAKPSTPPSTGTTTVYASMYNGRKNGDRPTWYFSKRMSAYPKTFTLSVSGCRSDMQVSNNGHRWESGGYIVKQSDVSGRGMAIVAPSSCKQSAVSATYIKY